jgi:hypothetical protein
LKPDDNPAGPLVWARKHVSLQTCPKSYITGESLSLLEEFLARRRMGTREWGSLTARQVEAFLILERELEAGINDGQHNTRTTI